MPNIVSSRGVHLTDDVVKIHDVFPSAVREEAKLYHEEEDEGASRVVIMDVFDLYGGEMLDQPEGEDKDTTTQLPAELLHQAFQEAEQIQRETLEAAEAERDRILQQAREEAEQLRQEAVVQGRQEGFETAVSKLQQITDGLEAAISQMEGDRAGYEAEYENQLRWMALEIASKVLARKVVENDTVLTEMVDRTMQGLKGESWVRVEVSQEMTRLIGQLEDMYDDLDNVEVSAIPADPGTILLETPSGVVDASLKTQLENLKTYFQNATE